MDIQKIIEALDQNGTTHKPLDRIALFPCDHEALHVYWEITNDRLLNISRSLELDAGSLHRALRVYDITWGSLSGAEATSYWELVVPEDATNWFIADIEQGRTYIVDYGVMTPENRFMTLLRSNSVFIPYEEARHWQEQHPMNLGLFHEEYPDASFFASCIRLA
ncbi:DUF4912 domain-containing protein [Paenibacillus aquistagni]|uniref:DUF4912 domain-containing protein n=1 Tax=Paenibacillus aquistagni TaxID=1852522 RepID=A0A1X7KMK8_9BACL|nr:DUF4912 domain-containing protein [Paenibacillus aquistagni]SMG42754.1 protein of unknown function [Paenibacillus aquistagni]